jgi:bifunctional DNA-binding transcriptional regulator/antitoxin component of YhaV-PrlF toxin-antitoxin module
MGLKKGDEIEFTSDFRQGQKVLILRKVEDDLAV